MLFFCGILCGVYMEEKRMEKKVTAGMGMVGGPVRRPGTVTPCDPVTIPSPLTHQSPARGPFPPTAAGRLPLNRIW